MPGQRHSHPYPTSFGHLHFLQNDWGLLRATAVTRTPNKSQHIVDSGKENSPAASAGIRTRNLSITSPAV